MSSGPVPLPVPMRTALPSGVIDGVVGLIEAASKPLRRSADCPVVRSTTTIRRVLGAGSLSKTSLVPSVETLGWNSDASVLTPAGSDPARPLALVTTRSSSVRGAGACASVTPKTSACAADAVVATATATARALATRMRARRIAGSSPTGGALVKLTARGAAHAIQLTAPHVLHRRFRQRLDRRPGVVAGCRRPGRPAGE